MDAGARTRCTGPTRVSQTATDSLQVAAQPSVHVGGGRSCIQVRNAMADRDANLVDRTVSEAGWR